MFPAPDLIQQLQKPGPVAATPGPSVHPHPEGSLGMAPPALTSASRSHTLLPPVGLALGLGLPVPPQLGSQGHLICWEAH